MLDRLLEAACSHGELDDVLRRHALAQRMDQAAAEAVAAAHAVHDPDQVVLAQVSLSARVQHSGPVVLARGNRAAQGDGYRLAAEALRQLARDALVSITFKQILMV